VGPVVARGAFGAALALAAVLAAAAPPPTTVQERLGHPASARLLILHADDFGMSQSVNRATAEALEKGWITSASVLVPCPWFPDVARFAKANPDADLGIHLALNSEWTTYRWGPLSARSEVPSLLDPDGYFPLVETTVKDQAKAPEVEKELRAQIDKARAAGLRLSHLDSHMGALFQNAALFEVYRRVGRDYGLPILATRDVRGLPGVEIGDDEILIDRVIALDAAVPRAQWRQAYEKLLAPLPPGVYEVILHLADDGPEMRGATADHPDWGAAWRQSDLDMVKSPAFRAFLKKQGFVLTSWRGLARAYGR
jgi:predicted glycoside hydrolase/deacetylase ChbG (UPF0249 family)